MMAWVFICIFVNADPANSIQLRKLSRMHTQELGKILEQIVLLEIRYTSPSLGLIRKVADLWRGMQSPLEIY